MKLDIQLFASGTIPRVSAPSNGDIRVIWESTPGTASQNYSTVSASVQVKRRSSGSTTGTFSGEVQIGSSGQSVSKKFSPLQTTWKTVGTYQATVNHNTDGTGSVFIGGYLSQTGTSLAGDYEASGTVTLDTISRVSPVSTSAASLDMGTTVTINTNRYVNTFTHTIRYAFGSTSGTIATNVGASTTWTPPVTLASQIPNSLKGTCTIYCDTYNGSTLIGTSSKTITLTIPASVKPSVSFTIEQVSPYINAALWVQFKSKALITTTADGIYGSTITGIVVEGDEYTYTGSPVTTNPIRNRGYQTFTVTVTDSRGRVNTASATKYIYTYTQPTLDVQIQRCDIDGNIDNNGEYCYYVFNSKAKALGDDNTPYLEFKIGYRLQNTGSYTYITINEPLSLDGSDRVLETSGILSENDIPIQFSTSNIYDIQFYAKDYYSTSTSVQTLDTGFDLLNFNPSGKSMAIGMVSQRTASEKVLDIDLKTCFSEDIDIVSSTLTLNNEWIMGYKASGDNFCVILPFNNSSKRPVTVDITSAEVYTGSWETITYVGVTVLQTFVKIGFSTNTALTNGNVYLTRITGTINT